MGYRVDRISAFSFQPGASNAGLEEGTQIMAMHTVGSCERVEHTGAHSQACVHTVDSVIGLSTRGAHSQVCVQPSGDLKASRTAYWDRRSESV